ncbi:sensor histidine kinase [Laceyella putida]|uniref:histidine kinase n=1 Tax=Laceyella putida TaxID=110101 RepID=A0ABW2RFM2_9BACL
MKIASIRVRFLVSFTAIFIISLILLVFGVLVSMVAIAGDVTSASQFYTHYFAQKPLSAQEENLYLDLKYMAKKQPLLLEQQQVWMNLEKKRLASLKMGLVVRKENRVLYQSPSLKDKQLAQALPPYEPANLKVRDTLEINGQYYSFVKFDYDCPDQAEGSLYLLKKVNPFTELVRKSLPLFLIVLLILFVGSNGYIYYLVSRSVIRPLLRLEQAANRIKEGELDFHVRPVSHDEIGKVACAFEEMRSKLKDSVEQQGQIEQSRKEMISSISHDLKTPITSIIGYVEGIRDGVANTPDKINQYLMTISAKARYMDHLIDELALFSKLDLKQAPFTFKKIHLQAYLRDYLEERTVDLAKAGFHVRHEWPGTPIWVWADPEKLARVLENVLDNSVKYGDKEEKRLAVIVSGGDDKATIQIEDNGAGIDFPSISRVFERFYRAEPSRSSRTGGSGLGLAIAKQIVEGHGGRIWATSEKGQGTSIFFTLSVAGEQREKSVDH